MFFQNRGCSPLQGAFTNICRMRMSIIIDNASSGRYNLDCEYTMNFLYFQEPWMKHYEQIFEKKKSYDLKERILCTASPISCSVRKLRREELGVRIDIVRTQCVGRCRPIQENPGCGLLRRHWDFACPTKIHLSLVVLINAHCLHQSNKTTKGSSVSFWTS